AVSTGLFELVRQEFFRTPTNFENFADFDEKILKVTHTNHDLSPALHIEVREKFEKHMTPDGARFFMPIRVDLLRKA
ncbi:MAG TPA: hypothetical protein PLK99_11665, partial [Burkholderiales bacterium]|nr:hypothetical protein [Burkholderiales bacterium]